MRRTPLILAAAALVLAAGAAAAQDDTYRDYVWIPRSYLGAEGAYARPEGEFRDYVSQGWGGGVHYLLRLDQDGWFGLRADASLLNYGHEREPVDFGASVGGRILLDLTTDNNIAFVGVGPQIGLPTGRLRPYANGFVGVSYIFTESSLQGTSSGESFANTTNYEDASFAFGGGGGLYIPLSLRRNPVSLDVGVTYRHNGTAEYLRHGDITDNPDGSITLHPVRSATNLATFHVGVSVGVR